MHSKTSPLVVALDSHDAAHALRLADSLKGVVPWVKVGLELFVHAGPDVVARLKGMGFKVFLDLKMFDIPNTVRGGILSGVQAGADMLTIHTLGGRRMAEAALDAAQSAGNSGPIVLGITVLTSMAPGELPSYSGDLADLATDLAAQAQTWGLHGIVCSGHETRAVKTRCGTNFICLTPGIRPEVRSTGETAPKDDQRRVMTPAEAVAAGSDYLVVGRPITQAADPAAAARAILTELTRTML